MLTEQQANEILVDLEDLVYNGNYPWQVKAIAAEFGGTRSCVEYWQERVDRLEADGWYLVLNLEVRKLGGSHVTNHG